MKKKEFINTINGIQMKESTKERMIQTCRDESAGTHRQLHLSRRAVAVACAAAVAAAFSVTAFAANLFGVKDLLIAGRHSTASVSTSETMDLITLSGYGDSPEAKACAEWNAFLSGYDTDRRILDSIGNDPTPFDKDYSIYSVYTQEMADQLDAIAAKYNLKLIRTLDIYEKPSELLARLGKDTLVRNGGELSNEVSWGYVCDDGTFRTEGTLSGDGKLVDYQFSANRKGTLSEVALNIGDYSSYREFAYTTSDGVNTDIAVSDEKSLIIADCGDYFIVVNILDESHQLSDGELKAAADSFALSELQK